VFGPKTFLIALLSGILLISGCTQNEERVYHIGMLNGLGEFLEEIPVSFKAKMTELGYREGENIVYDVQSTMFEPERERQILEKFVEDKVDLIFTFPTEVSMAAKAATNGTDVPTIFAIANIEGTGLVDSIREPGGHTTGVRYPGPDLAIKRFEVMREPAAQAAGVTLIEFPADNASELQEELDARNKSGDVGFDAILFIPEPLSTFAEPFEVIGKFAYEHKMPIGGLMMHEGGYGSIFGINVDIPKTAQQAAVLADKILRGTPAGTIPVVSSESYFEIDYNVAQELGVNVSEGLLARADNIIR
jgi:putative ABC transport system substrate-binding protein